MTPGERSRLVSVVVPVHNGAAFVADALESVLAQTYAPVEVIVVDDGSDDDTASIVARHGPAVAVIRQPHAGPAAARNAGVSAASGEYISFLDADDLWPVDKLAVQVAYLHCPQDADMVFGTAIQFSGDGADHSFRLGPDAGPVVAALVPGGLLTRLETFRRVGPFSSQWRVGEFIDWFARAQEMGLSCHVLDHLVLFRRLHDANLGRQDSAARIDFTRILRARLERSRGELA
jgi:glycosyltransferase involved in cell wall biosynthesis